MCEFEYGKLHMEGSWIEKRNINILGYYNLKNNIVSIGLTSSKHEYFPFFFFSSSSFFFYLLFIFSLILLFLQEFMKQRRRWVLSDMSNMLLVFKNLLKLAQKNDSFSIAYILYMIQMFIIVLLSPASTIVILAG